MPRRIIPSAAILALASTLAACSGDSEADKAARALGYAIAPAGGEIYTGAITFWEETWSFRVTIPEGWRWRKLKAHDTSYDISDGIEALPPDAGAAQLERGAAYGDPASCTAQIMFLSARLPGEEATQAGINAINRSAVDVPYDGRPGLEGFHRTEAVESGAYTGLYRQRSQRRQYERGKYVIDGMVRMEWQTPDLIVTATCRLTGNPPLADHAHFPATARFARSTELLPGP